MQQLLPMISVVDDDESVRCGLTRMLKAHGYRTSEYASAGDLLDARGDPGPGCLLLDVRMPAMSGLELQARLAECGRERAVVFMTGHADVGAGVRAMKAGAVDYLVKPFTDDALLAAIQRALAWDDVLRRQQVERDELLARAARLTRREREVCELVVTGLINKQIAAVIGTTEKTVKVHRARAMAKMGASSLVELVRLVDRLGPGLGARPWPHAAAMRHAAAG